MPKRKNVIGDRKKSARSRVSNGRDLLPGIDGRSPTARRYRDLVSAIIAERGGSDLITETIAQLIRRFSAASVLAEQMEARIARGETVDIGEHALLCSTLVRVANHIGIDRIATDITPTGFTFGVREIYDPKTGTIEIIESRGNKV